jgi:putative ABC transport system permease protein
MALETSLSAVLLIVAGIVGHAFITMQLTPRGFDADQILSVRVVLPVERYATAASRAEFFDRLSAEVAKIPGVERFDLGYGAIPPSDFIAGSPLVLAGAQKPAWEFGVRLGFITPDYLSVMGIPLLQGRNFVPADLTMIRASDAPRPALVSRSMARRFWPDGGAVGALFRTGDEKNVRYYEVIGVAGDVSGTGLDAPMCQDCDVQVYLPLFPERQFTELLLRLRPGATPPTAALQAAIATIDPEVPSDDELGTAEARLASFNGRPRLMASVFAAFAGVGIFLIAIGLSTLVSRAVAQRTREMGIRLALGATPGSVRSLIVTEGLRPALVGLVFGLAGAIGVTRSIRAMLYGFSPADPLTLALAPLLLIAIIVAALTVPALRATRVDPAATLRAE